MSTDALPILHPDDEARVNAVHEFLAFRDAWGLQEDLPAEVLKWADHLAETRNAFVLQKLRDDLSQGVLTVDAVAELLGVKLGEEAP